MKFNPLLGVFLLALSIGSTTRGAGFVDVGLGYTQLDIGGSVTDDLDGEGSAGLYFRIGAGQAIEKGWRIGFGLEVTGYRTEFNERLPDSDDFTTASFKELDMFIPELYLGYQIPFGRFFIQPNVGIGLAVANFRAGNVLFDESDLEDIDEWAVAPTIRPGIKVGYGWDHIAFGLEGAYLITDLNFGDGIGGWVHEAFLGAFFEWRF